VAPAAFAGATLSAGVSGGILFTAAHELVRLRVLVFFLPTPDFLALPTT